MFKFHLRGESCCDWNFFTGNSLPLLQEELGKGKIDSLEKLSDYSEKEILQLHGFGKNTMQKLKAYMKTMFPLKLI
jgi:hypothetical protein